MACDWQGLAIEVAWEAFKRKLKERILRKLAGRTVAAAAIAILDGPLPIGDVFALLFELWSLIEVGMDLDEAIAGWEFVRGDTVRRTERLVAQIERLYGAGILDHPRCCECLLTYLRALARARRAGAAHFKRALIRELRALFDRLKETMRRLGAEQLMTWVAKLRSRGSARPLDLYDVIESLEEVVASAGPARPSEAPPEPRLHASEEAAVEALAGEWFEALDASLEARIEPIRMKTGMRLDERRMDPKIRKWIDDLARRAAAGEEGDAGDLIWRLQRSLSKRRR